MTKYIKGKDGKFKGSIGDGKSNVPTTTPNISSYASGNSLAASSAPVDAAYAAFLKKKEQSAPPAEPVKLTPLNVEIFKDDDQYVISAGTSEVLGFTSYNDGKWQATVHSQWDDGMDGDNIADEEFDTLEAANAWVSNEVGMRAAEMLYFDQRYAQDPIALNIQQQPKIARHDELWESHIGTTDYGALYGSIAGVTREADIYPYESGYMAEVKKSNYDASTGDTQHMRTFPNFETAFAFATEMTLIMDDYEEDAQK